MLGVKPDVAGVEGDTLAVANALDHSPAAISTAANDSTLGAPAPLAVATMASTIASVALRASFASRARGSALFHHDRARRNPGAKQPRSSGVIPGAHNASIPACGLIHEPTHNPYHRFVLDVRRGVRRAPLNVRRRNCQLAR